MNDFVKNDKGKLQWSLMPFEQLEDVVRVLMAGATKYGRENWKKCDDVSRYKDALMRHVTAYIKGEVSDPEDNLPHLAHAICNCLFLQYFDSKIVVTNTTNWIPVEEVKENEDIYLKTVDDKDGVPCRQCDYVMFCKKGDNKKHLGMLLYDMIETKGFIITSHSGTYKLSEIKWFKFDHRPKEL